MKKHKKGNAALTILVFVVIAAVALLFVEKLGYLDKLGATPDEGGEGEEDTGGVSDVLTDCSKCSDPTNTLTIGAIKYKWNPTNTSGESARMFLNGKDEGSKSDGTTKGLTCGDDVELIYGLTSSSAYASRVKFKMPCGSVSSASLVNDANELILADGLATISIFNSDTGNKNDGANSYDGTGDNETIGTAQEGIFRNFNVITGDKYGLSAAMDQGKPKGKIHFYFEFNGSMYDYTTATLDGKNGARGIKPSWLALANSDDEIMEWTVDSCPTGITRSCDLNLGNFRIKAKTGENPTGGGTAGAGAVGSGDIKVSMIYEGWYLDTLSGLSAFGIQKDDGTAVTSTVPMSQTFYLSVT